jgi:predicted dinucleotide-binding enzyme
MLRRMRGKPVLDACNPSAGAPVKGVLQLFTGPNESLMEQLQKEFPEAKFVKVFNSVGVALMVNPQLKGGPPTMFICGNDLEAKKITTGFLDEFGWETMDVGGVESARAIEPLCMLWCLPGFLQNDWVHAFKMLRD